MDNLEKIPSNLLNLVKLRRPGLGNKIIDAAGHSREEYFKILRSRELPHRESSVQFEDTRPHRQATE